MFQTSQHFPIRFCVALMLAMLCLLLPLIALASGGVNESAGSYEGEYDESGLRSGFGTWAYYNYLYAGEWENNRPNGEGTLYRHEVIGVDGHDELIKSVISGTWAEGLAEGTIEQTEIYTFGSMAYCYDVAAGLGIKDENIISADGTGTMKMVFADSVIGVVQPWHYDWPEPDLPTPLASYEYDAAAAEWNTQRRQAASDTTAPEALPEGAVYQGEYDVNGKRSGQGTLAYDNYLYVGEWKNDKPNGEGTLYFIDNEFSPDGLMLRAHWVDGQPDGTVYETSLGIWQMPDGKATFPVTFRFPGVNRGYLPGNAPVLATNARLYARFTDGEGRGFKGVPPWEPHNAELRPGIQTPWHLHEAYPAGMVEPSLTKMEVQQIGMDVTPGNLGNRIIDSDIIQAGGWIFFSAKRNDVFSICRMRPDGSDLTTLYESKNPDFSPGFRVLGDWVYLGEPYNAGDTFKFRADDPTLIPIRTYQHLTGRVIDGWEYIQANNDAHELYRINLDFTEIIRLGKVDEAEQYNQKTIIHADADWVYLFARNEFDNAQALIRVKNDGSGEMQTHALPLQYDIWLGAQCGQIVGGRFYYSGRTATAYQLHSVDIGFAEQPKKLLSNTNASTFHVTEDAIFYSVVDDPIRNRIAKLVRMDHDGQNQQVLLEDIDGQIASIFIAGDWMIFETLIGDQFTPFMMKVDGSQLRRLN